MDMTTAIESATRAGVLREALPDALNRATSHFADQHPTVEDLDAYYEGLRSLAPHLWPQPSTQTPPAPTFDPQQRYGVPVEVWEKLSASEKLTRARAGQPPPGPRQRPGPYIATRAEQKALEGKSAAERLAWVRERAAQQQQR